MSNVVRLPRPLNARDPILPFALYFRIGRDQHRDMLDVLAQGEKNFSGSLLKRAIRRAIENSETEALRRGLDVILDPNTHALATIGGHSPAIAALPWGLPRPHRTEDFSGVEARTRARLDC